MCTIIHRANRELNFDRCCWFARLFSLFVFMYAVDRLREGIKLYHWVSDSWLDALGEWGAEEKTRVRLCAMPNMGLLGAV